MRLKKHFYVCICMLLIGIGSLQAKEVTLTEAGTLSSKISDTELNTLTELTVNGPINGSDIKIIRAMGGTLKTLDLKNANIVEGGDSYYLTDKFTQNDVIGDYMFYAMTALEKIVMPKDVWSIGTWYSYNNNHWNADKTELSGRPKTYNTSESDSNFGCAAFYQCVNLKQITFSNALVYIGGKAFGNCVKLTSVTIPEGVELMGNYAFINCTELTSVSIPSTFGNAAKTIKCDKGDTGLNDIQGNGGWGYGFKGIFYKCTKLANIKLTEGIKYLGGEMFSGNTAITSITLPATLERMNSALRGCTGLTALSFPEGLKQIGSLNECSNLKTLTIPAGVNVDDFSCTGCSALTSINFKGTIGTTISNYAFDGCSSLKSINLFEGIATIGNYAFKDCTTLTQLTMPATLTSIGDFCFQNSGLTGLSLQRNLTIIGEYAFDGCANLATINFPPNVTEIKRYTFNNCAKLKDIVLPNGLIYIKDYAFNGCAALGKVTIPGGVQNISPGAFKNSGLTEVILKEGVMNLSNDSFDGCLLLKKVTFPTTMKTIGGFSNTGIKEIAFAEGAAPEAISDYAFLNCDSLSAITLPNSIKSLGIGAFYDCDTLKTVKLPTGITKIAKQAFYHCGFLQSVTIPQSVTEIEAEAFAACSKLTAISLPSALTTIGIGSFHSAGLTSITLPEGMTTIEPGTFGNSKLKSAKLPKSLKQITSSNEGYTLGSLPNEYSNFRKYISMYRDNSGAFQNCKELETIDLNGAALTTLGENTFRECDKLRNIDLTVTKLEEIPTCAFYSCDSLQAVTFPATLKTIGEQAFYYCKKIRSVDLSATSLTKIENWFSGIDSLRIVKLPNTVTEIGESAFNSSPIEEINFPAGLTTIGNYAFNDNQLKNIDLSATKFTTIKNWFAGNGKLRTVKLPETVTSLAEGAFDNCYIEEINFPAALTTIGARSLRYCRIDTLRLPATVTEIGQDAFYYAKFDCVEIPSTVTKINSGAFYNAEIRGSLHITPNASLTWGDGNTPFYCYGNEYVQDENGSYNRYWHLPDVHWNSAAEFPRNKFGQIDNLYLPTDGVVSSTDNIGYIFYNGMTKRIDLAYSRENNKYSFSVNKEMKTQMINYRKYFSTTSGYGEAAGWKTLVLPFDVKEISYERDSYNEKDTVALAPFGSKALETAGTLPFWLYELGADGNYKAATEIKAHKAYLICMPNNDKYPSENNISGYVNFTTADATNGVSLKPTAGVLKRSQGTKFDLVPTYEGVMQHDTVYVLNESNRYYADDKTYPIGSVFVKNYNERGSYDPAVYPFEAYLVTNEGKTAAASTPMLYSIGGDGGPITGIEDLPVTPDKATKAYSRDGVLYINTDADRTIRIYDVTGRTVRVIEAREGVNEVHGLDSGIYLLEGQKVAVGR